MLVYLESPILSVDTRVIVRVFTTLNHEVISFIIANIVVAAPQDTIEVMSSMSPLHMSNEHDESFARSSPSNDDAPGESESELSDVGNPTVDEPSPASTNHEPEFGAEDSDASNGTLPEEEEQSDDAEFDEEDTPPATSTNGQQHQRSDSVDVSRPAKRKSDIADHESYIRANPELYGLRRSVWHTNFTFSQN